MFQKIKKNGMMGDKIHTNINSVRNCPWISKRLFEVREHTFNYFVIKDSQFSKQREIIMPD